MFKLLWRDKIIAKQDKNENPFTSKMVAEPAVPQHYLPFGLFGFDKREVPLSEFVIWAKQRCFPKERVDSDKLLEELGLDRYDSWEIVKITKAKMGNDDYTIDF